MAAEGALLGVRDPLRAPRSRPLRAARTAPPRARRAPQFEPPHPPPLARPRRRSPGFPFLDTREAAKAQLLTRGCDPANAMVAFWFLTPEHHVIETLLVNAVFVPLALWLWRAPWRVAVAGAPRPRAACGSPLALLDGALGALTWVCGAATLWYKLHTDCAGRVRLAYLLQPCHISNFMLMALSLGWGARSGALFEVYQCTVFGALFALATPDTRGLDLPFEKLYFFVQHGLLLLLPAVWIARRRFPLVEDWRAWVCCWAGMTLVHWDVFAAANLLTGHNVNYMMVPPQGPVEAAGKAFRPFMIVVCLVVSRLMKQGAWP